VGTPATGQASRSDGYLAGVLSTAATVSSSTMSVPTLIEQTSQDVVETLFAVQDPDQHLAAAGVTLHASGVGRSGEDTVFLPADRAEPPETPRLGLGDPMAMAY
jgi:hypothetical protein